VPFEYGADEGTIAVMLEWGGRPQRLEIMKH